jgi:hypothetical protein
MNNSKKDKNLEEFSEKVRKGLELTFQKLLKEKKANNQTFVFYEDGKIVKIKAVDIPD